MRRYLAIPLALSLSSPLRAETRQWLGGGGDWNIPENWNPAGIPAAGDDVRLTIADASAQIVTYGLLNSGTLNSLVIDAPAPGRMTLTIDSGSLTSLREDIGASGNAAIVQTGGANLLPFGTLTINAGGRYDLAGGLLGATTLRVLAGGTLHQTGGLMETQNLIQDGGTLSGTIHSRGSYTYNSGPFIGSLINDGNLQLNQDMLIPDGCQNGLDIGGLITIAPGRTLGIGGSGLHNGSSIAMFGGTLATTVEFMGARESALHNQFAGLHSVSTDLHIGFGPGAEYLMRGGELSVGATLLLGVEAPGIMRHSGGDVRAATVRIGNSAAGSGSYLMTGGTLSCDRIDSDGSLVISDSAHVNLTGDSNTISTIRSLVFGGSTGAWTGQLDIGQADLAVPYTGASPLPALADQIRSGHAGATWTGQGIISGSADATHFGIGFLDDGSAVRMRLTRYGDANLDGAVNINDFTRLAANFGLTGKFWFDGDYNYDGIVNVGDFALLAGNFNLSTTGTNGTISPLDWATLASAIPEPVAATGIVASFATFYSRSRRRQRQ